MDKKIKLLAVIGARPQFIKHAAFEKALTHNIELVTVHTGQHYDALMSQVFFEQLHIQPPIYQLNAGSDTHGAQTAKMMLALEPVFQKEKPDIILVYGDTNSTLAAAVTGSKMNIPIAHIEAGLRSFNREMPEEINRVLTDHVSSLLFCPSQESVRQLATENINRHVYNVGDIMQDAVRLFAALELSPEETIVFNEINRLPYNLLTIHRPVNTDNPGTLSAILAAIAQDGRRCVWPVHPRAAKMLTEHGINLPVNIQQISPASYTMMLRLVAGSSKVLTDSGGLQKECYWLKRPCITLREETEWTETVATGKNILTGSDPVKIAAALAKTYDADENWEKLYGDGHASEKIIAKLLEF